MDVRSKGLNHLINEAIYVVTIVNLDPLGIEHIVGLLIKSKLLKYNIERIKQLYQLPKRI